MDKTQYEKLLAEIGGGGKQIGLECHESQLQAENDVTAAIEREFEMLLLFGDALKQFYVDTIREFSSKLSPVNSQMTMVCFHWHVVSCTRYRAAFDLWKKGYYFEAATLSRTLWETALTLAGLKKGVVTIEVMFGGKIEDGIKKSADEIISLIKKADNAIQSDLIWKNQELSADARSAVNLLQQMMNQATHKSNLAIASNLSKQLKGENIPIFTRFDSQLVGMSWNILQCSMWPLITTMAYLEQLCPHDKHIWNNRYEKLLAVFDETNKSSSIETARGFREVVQTVFVR